MPTIFIGEDLYDKLPGNEQETFELHERYKPDAIGEQLEEFEENDEEWSDEVFSDLDDYQEFFGGDFSEVGGNVYKKKFDSCAITPGTNFMTKLCKQIKNHF